MASAKTLFITLLALLFLALAFKGGEAFAPAEPTEVEATYLLDLDEIEDDGDEEALGCQSVVYFATLRIPLPDFVDTLSPQTDTDSFFEPPRA
ncbi:hypothetical protein [Hydrogenimonas sp.]